MAGAYGAANTTTSHRKEWNQAEWEEKAKAKDEAHREHAKATQEAIASGKAPPKMRKKEDIPKPTERMQQRTIDLELDKDLNKVQIVSGDKKPGFWCDVCRRNSKDSVAYLDHLNGRSHLKRLGQTTRVVKSSLNDVRLKIAELREKTKENESGKKYDFEARLKEIREAEKKEKVRRKEEKALKRGGGAKVKDEIVPMDEDAQNMAAMMGFAGFGTGGPKK